MSPKHIFHPPGWVLRQFADFLFSKRTFEKVFGPILQKMEQEHLDALNEGRPWKARMVLLRGYWSFWAHFGAHLPISLARLIYKIWRITKTGD